VILPPELTEWAEAIFGLYYELRDGTIGGFGNAVAIASFGDFSVGLTAAHNVCALDGIAVRGSPFSTLREARGVNPKFRGRIKTALAERHVGTEQNIASLEFGDPPEGKADVAVVGLRQRPSSAFRFKRHFGLKLLPPPIGDTISAIGMHGFEPQGVVDLEDGRQRWLFKNDCRIIPARVSSHVSEGPNAVEHGFEVEGEFPSGLSGSPVLWQQGDRILVCGVVSLCFEGLNQATVASAQAALELTVRFDEKHANVSVHELARRGFVPVYGDELQAFAP
jgi:hypothetical protein